jgi:hypothetical protein
MFAGKVTFKGHHISHILCLVGQRVDFVTNHAERATQTLQIASKIHPAERAAITP